MRRPALLLVACALGAMLSACVVAPYGPPGPVVYGPPVAVAPMAPPPPQVEVIPAIPFAGAIWIGGYWGWSAGRHVWIQGRWERPRPGYRWEPHRWEPQGGQWHLRGGEWRSLR